MASVNGRRTVKFVPCPVTEEIRSGRFHEVDEGQAVLECYLLGTLKLLEPHRLQRPGLDAGIVHHDHAADPADEADARNAASARDGLPGVRCVEQVSGQRGEFEEGGGGVEQQSEALARQQLAAPRKPGA